MSSQTPHTPRSRRRIAGERKGSRPVAEQAPDHEAPSPEASEAPAATRVQEPARPAPKPPAVTDKAPGAADVTASEPAGVPGKVLAALAGLALVLLVVAAGPFVDGMGLQDYREVQAESDVDRARRTAPAAAERAAAAILAYDHKSLETDRDAAAKLMTDDYREQYLDTFEKLVSELAVERKAVVRADVRASGVALAAQDRVEVLLFVNQTTTSTANSGEEQVALNRVIFTMERVDGTWLVDEITPY